MPIHLTLEKLPDITPTVLTVAANEFINQDYCYIIRALLPTNILHPNTLLHSQACVAVSSWAEQNTQYFHGMIQAITYVKPVQNGLVEVLLQLTPWLNQLKQRNNYRSFHNRALTHVLKTIFKEYPHIHFSFKLNETIAHAINDYVQYNETDFAFVNRLLQENGVSYFFQHFKNYHVLLLVDSNQHYPHSSIKHPSSYPWLDDNTHVSSHNAIATFNWQTPTENLYIEQHSLTAKCKSLNFPDNFKTPAAGYFQLQIINERQQARHLELKTHQLGLRPGLIVDINSEKMLIIKTQHHAKTKIDVTSYENTITCIPVTQTFRPQQKLKAPPIHGVQSARITTISQQKLYTNHYGQLKCQFFWDPYQASGDKMWLRSSHSWASQNRNAVFLAHHNHEVLCGFCYGLAKQPNVLGGVYNNQCHPPFNPIKYPYSNGFNIQHNKIYFDNHPDKACFYCSAQRDFTLSVKHELQQHIQHHHWQTIQHGKQVHQIKQGKKIIHATKIILKVQQSYCVLTKSGIHFMSPLIQVNANAKPAARVNDLHQCPQYTPTQQPHHGGRILQGSADVFINGKPAARALDKAHCDHAQDQLSQGSQSILINNRPAIRQSDPTQHQGKVTQGSKDVVFG